MHFGVLFLVVSFAKFNSVRCVFC